MRIIGIANHIPSHIDFGGRGFLRVMSGLASLGHDVRWVTCGRTARRLTELGWPTQVVPEIRAGRRVNPYVDVAQLERVCRRLEEVVRDNGPDVLIIDRVNTLCRVIARRLDVPFVAIGTPGGYWKQKRGVLIQAPQPLRAFAKLSARLQERLQWSDVDLQSAWLRSDDLNVTFLGRSFYGDPAESPGRTAYVSVFDKPAGDAAARRLGIVLGNTGQLARMHCVLSRLVEEGCIPMDLPVDILAGGRTRSPELCELLGLLRGHDVTVHGWVDYAERYSQMRMVISFGGIGAIWQAVNHRVPMLLVDGGVGDQRFNCLTLARLGAAEVLASDSDGSTVGASFQRLQSPAPYVAAMDALRAEDNYSDSLDTVVQKIVRIASR